MNKVLYVLALFVALAGCATTSSQPWLMPAKKTPESAAIFGYIDGERDSRLPLGYVHIIKKGRVYAGLGRNAIGEKVYVMSNNLFIAPNVAPGTYYVSGFEAGKNSYVFGKNQITYFEVSPGQLKFIGSFRFEEKRGGVFTMGSFDLKPIDVPSEMQMLRWLEKISDNTGWEPSIRTRIRQLGGTPANAGNVSQQ